MGLISLSVVVLTYGRAEELETCLKSLRAATGAGTEIIVAANAPDSLTESVLLTSDADVVLRFPENIGVDARNRAAARARGEFLLFVDDDCEFAQDAIPEMMRAFRDPAVGAVGPAIYSAEQRERIIATGHRVGRVDGRVAGTQAGADGRAWDEVPLLGANGLMIRRRLFLDVGGFLSDYFVFFEDSDLSERLKALGFALLCSRKARMWHPSEHPSTAPRLLRALGLGEPRRAYLLARNKLIFMRRNRPLPTFLLYLALSFPLYTMSVLALCLLLRQGATARAYGAGVRHGLAWALRPRRRVRLIFEQQDRLAIRAFHTASSWTDPIRPHINPRARSIVDVGCGQGQPLDILNRRGRLVSVGVDTFEPYLAETRRRGIHLATVKSNVLALPFRARSFDVAMCLQVIEHLDKEHGHELLKELERVAKTQVIVTTPNGFMPHPAVDGNPHQVHLSGWTPEEMRALGFRVEKQGLTQLYGEHGIVHRIRIEPLRKAVFLLGLGFEGLCRLIPPMKRLANYYIVCVKDVA